MSLFSFKREQRSFWQPDFQYITRFTCANLHNGGPISIRFHEPFNNAYMNDVLVTTFWNNVGKPTFPTMFLRVHEVDSVQTRSAHLFAQPTSLIHAQGPMGFIIYINQLVLFFFHDTKQFKMIHTIYFRKKVCFCHAMWNNMGLIFRSMTWIDGAVKFEQGLIAKLIYKIWIQYIWTRFVC